jgi:ATP-dependent DNA helicase PIF1
MTPEQKHIYDFVRTHPNDSILITGPAGTGKTYLTNALLKWLQTSCTPPIHVAVTGSTGAAAILIEGRTLHSYLGIGLANAPPATLVAKMSKKKMAQLRRLHTLVVDEISMISAELLDIIDAVLRLVRHSERPFGGVRFIFIGDACQLPPVSGQYFFKAEAWTKAAPQIFQLTQLIRQEGDTRFQELLMRARWGELNAEDVTLLKARVGTKAEAETGIQPTRLYAINRNVDAENDKAFNALLLEQVSGENVRTYPTEYYDPSANVTALLKIKAYANSARIPESIVLCKGAQVMVTWNQAPETGIVNGTRGVVLGVAPDSVTIRCVNGNSATISYMKIDYPDDATPHCIHLDGDAQATPHIRFLPIRLAYALSIHKSQGVTLDAAEIDLGKTIFEYGQAYTALSRVKSLDALHLTAFRRRAFTTHPDVLAFYGKSGTQ